MFGTRNGNSLTQALSKREGRDKQRGRRKILRPLAFYNSKYWCPLKIYQELENERKLAQYEDLMRKREICYLRSILKSVIDRSVSDISIFLINSKKKKFSHSLILDENRACTA